MSQRGSSDGAKTVEIGRVGRPHGLGGEVKVRPHRTDSTLLYDLERVVLRKPGELDLEIGIERVRPGGDSLIVKFVGIHDRDRAAELSGRSLCASRAAFPEPEPGEYYLVDLIGASVFGPHGRVGKVVEIRTHPSVDSVIIELEDGRHVEQALVEPWIASIDLAEHRIELSSTEGWV